jgi:hypothetical protein
MTKKYVIPDILGELLLCFLSEGYLLTTGEETGREWRLDTHGGYDGGEQERI